MAVAVLKVDKLFEAATKHAREMRDLRNAHESKLGELTSSAKDMGLNVHQQIGGAQEREAAVAKTAKDEFGSV